MQLELQYKTNIWIQYVETSKVGVDIGYETFSYFGPGRYKNCGCLKSRLQENNA
jgi:hypothetical protein